MERFRGLSEEERRQGQAQAEAEAHAGLLIPWEDINPERPVEPPRQRTMRGRWQ